ncbi:MAG: hypothetical protein ACKVP2_07320 [Burkholderiales bacterium]
MGEATDGSSFSRYATYSRVTPIAPMAAVSASDPATAKRAFDAMMTMTKINIAAIEKARRG